jgi:hypothetical protein
MSNLARDLSEEFSGKGEDVAGFETVVSQLSVDRLRENRESTRITRTQSFAEW